MKPIVFVKPLDRISLKDLDFAGGKGANLGELIKFGISVPEGFIIGDSAFIEFLKAPKMGSKIKKMVSNIDKKGNGSLLAQRMIAKEKIPFSVAQDILAAFDKLGASRVAVRSSAAGEDSKSDSFAGQMETVLGVERKDLLAAVKKCWLSLYGSRSIAYRRSRGLKSKKLLISVVVQRMMRPEVSGVCFTANPVTKDARQAVIEAVWGLGESLVQGSVTPDRYVLGKKEWILLDIFTSEQVKMICDRKGKISWSSVPRSKRGAQKLAGTKIIELAKICRKIERHYHSAQDIEWACEDGRFFILQARPITTL